MKRSDLAVLLSLGALWGGSFLFMRMSAGEFGSLVLAGLRAIGAAVCFLPLLASRGRMREWRAHWKPIAVIGLTNSALPFVLFSFAAKTLPAGLSSIIDAVTPLFVALIGWLWLGEKLDTTRGAGMLVGFAGVLWLAGNTLRVHIGGAGWALAACVAATVLYGYSVDYTRQRLSGVSPVVVAAGSRQPDRRSPAADTHHALAVAEPHAAYAGLAGDAGVGGAVHGGGLRHVLPTDRAYRSGADNDGAVFDSRVRRVLGLPVPGRGIYHDDGDRLRHRPGRYSVDDGLAGPSCRSNLRR